MFDHGFQKLKTRNIWPWVMRRLERVSKERMFLKSTLEMIAMTVTVQLFLAFAIAMFAHKRDGVGYAMIPIYLYFTCWAFLDNYPTIVGYRSRKEIQGD